MRSAEDAVFHLQNLAVEGVHKNGISTVADPFASQWRYFKAEEPVVGQKVFRSPISARQDFTIGPTTRHPAFGSVVGSYSESARRLVMVLIATPIQGARPGVPTFGFSDPLIATGAGMRLYLTYPGSRAGRGAFFPRRGRGGWGTFSISLSRDVTRAAGKKIPRRHTSTARR
jgi:hypothetical protein